MKKGTTVLFALWPNHISARSDGRSSIVRLKKNVHDKKYVHIWDGDEEKMLLLGNNIVCFVGVHEYCMEAYDMLIKEIGSGVMDKEVLTKAVKIVQTEYIDKFVKFPNDENKHDNCFPGGIFFVGFDGEYYLGRQDLKPMTFSHMIDKKEVKFICCGGGSRVAIVHLEEQLKEQFEGRRELKTIGEVSELLAESLVVTSLNDPSTGGTFQCIEYPLGGMPEISHERRHVIGEIVKHYEHTELVDSICIPIFAEFHRDAMEKEYIFQQNLKAMLPGIHRIMNLGGSKPDLLALRLLFFKTNKDYVEAVEMLKGPPIIEEINGVAIFWKQDISKDFFEDVISGWEKQEMF